MIAIIDYGAGNLSSVQKALNFLGADNRITADPAEILAADRVILPGVGAFGDAMAAMRSRGLVDTVGGGRWQPTVFGYLPGAATAVCRERRKPWRCGSGYL